MELKNPDFAGKSLKETAAVIVGASSSIGLTLIPELLNKYRTVVLTEQRSEYSEFLQQVE